MPEHLDPRNDPDSRRGPESHPGGGGCLPFLAGWPGVLAALVAGCLLSIAVSYYVLAALGW